MKPPIGSNAITCVHPGCEHWMHLQDDPSNPFYRCPLGHTISVEQYLQRLAPDQ